MEPPTFTLSVPAHRREAVIQSLVKMIPVGPMESLRKKIKVLTPTHPVAAWERCLKLTEAKKISNIIAFWDSVIGEGSKIFHTEFDRYNNELCTALVENLFHQFQGKSIFICTEQLAKTVSNIGYVNWNKLEKSGIVDRLKQCWAAWGPLMVNSDNNLFTDTRLSTSLGLSEDGFTEIFFSTSSLFPNALGLCLSKDILGIIANNLLGKELLSFRGVCRTFHNVVEEAQHLRLRHRIYLIENNRILLQVVGKIMFLSNRYIITDTYKVTKLTHPLKTREYRIGYRCLIGAHVSQDDNGFTTFFIANRVGDSVVILQKIKADELEKMTDNQVMTNNQVTQYVANTYPNMRMSPSFNNKFWKEEVLIRVNGDALSLVIKFYENIVARDGNFFRHEPTGVTRVFQTAVTMSDFEESACLKPEEIIPNRSFDL